jgi:hypothetical protein
MSDRYKKTDSESSPVSNNTPDSSIAQKGQRTHRATNTASKEEISSTSLKKMSDVRRGQFEAVIDQKGMNKQGVAVTSGVTGARGNPQKRFEADIKRAIETAPSLYRVAELTSGSNPMFQRGGVDRAMPEIYSPLFQIANLNLPRDRMTMNAWNRNFFDTHPVVRNAITLHATYPISKINIKCKDRKVEQFFNDMAERIDLFDVIAGVALEFWKLGEVFPYAELDENNGIWSSITIQNPDYITVKKSGIANTSEISLRPDEVMKKIVSSNHPSDAKLRAQIPKNIIYHIKRNEPIPLDSFNVHHLKLLSSWYDTRGTSIIVSCYKDLMLYDKLRECFSFSATMLTDQGFKKYSDLIVKNADGSVHPNTEYKIATYNTATGEIEYQYATDAVLRHYSGKMKHFKGEKVDLTVTPGHRMYIKTTGKKNGKTYWKDYYFTEAKNITDKTYCKFKSKAKYVGDIEPKYAFIDGRNIPIELFLEFLGYVISEGCVYTDTLDERRFKRFDYKVSINQYTSGKHYQQMRKIMQDIATLFDRKLSSYMAISSAGYSAANPGERWDGAINSKELTLWLKDQIGIDGNTTSHHKHLPRWVLELSPRLLKILLDALVAGDGSTIPSKHGGNSIGYRYSTVSKQLADDVYELVYKCGYVPTLSVVEHKYDDRDTVVEYLVLWSDTNYGDEPIIYGHPDHNGAKVYDEDYDGLVWCLTVPNETVIVRDNGKISVQGNCKFAQADSLINPLTVVSVGGTAEGEFHPSDHQLEAYKEMMESAQWDKDFKIITHAGVKIERVGANGQIVDTQNDFNFIRENLYAGLMVPKAIMDSEGSTYANASVGLEVLRTRYISFRNMIEKWLEKKIFAPIAELQGFFESVNGEKVLLVPQVDWNQINLYDLNDYIQALGGYVDKNRISIHTLYRSLGLNWEEEQRLIKEEAIRTQIAAKENETFKTMSLSELRNINPDEPIMEKNKLGESMPTPGENNGPGDGPENMPTMPPDVPGAIPEVASPPSESGGEGGAPPAGLPPA